MAGWDPLQVVAAGVIVALQWDLLGELGRRAGWLEAQRTRLHWKTFQVVASVFVPLSLALELAANAELLPAFDWIDWAWAGALIWGMCVAGCWAIAKLLWFEGNFNPGRRRMLKRAAQLMFAVPPGVAAHGIIQRREFNLREVDVEIPGLPADLDGLRIVQLSDIHLGAFLEPQTLERAVAAANELRPSLAVVTGDLITLRADWLEQCLRLLSSLRAEAGVFGCFGNHEQAARCERFAQELGARWGLTFLRQQSQRLRFGRAVLNIVGVDHQRKSFPYLVGVEELVDSSAVNLLLSHNPDVFPVAAAKGFQLTLSGHTHGGQITLGVFQQQLNPGRLYTPYVYGLYRMGRAAMYVTSGLGTVVVPVRLGAPAEVAVIRLCAT